MVHEERLSLARQLRQLPADQWEAPSLCSQWTVEEVVAHLAAGASLGPVRWMRSVLGARFDFHLHNERQLREFLGPTPEATLSRFDAVALGTTAPWGPVQAWLAEIIIHGQDIRQPLELPERISEEALLTVAGFLVSTNFTMPSGKIADGLLLRSTTGGWSHGSGPAVEAPLLTLVMAMAGRGVYCAQLRGDGAAEFRQRAARLMGS